MVFGRDGIIVWLKVERASARETVQAYYGSLNSLPRLIFPIASCRGYFLKRCSQAAAMMGGFA